MSVTSIRVTHEAGRHRASLRAGLLRPLLVRAGADGCTIGLVATSALLLGGDQMEISVEVGPGATVHLRDIAGTVAYDGRGIPARWDVRVVIHDGGRLRWSGEPFVVADGADVVRQLRVEAAGTARLVLRESLVLGRFGELGGRLTSRAEAAVDGVGVYREDLVLRSQDNRTAPGMLGRARVIDSVLSLGRSTVGRSASHPAECWPSAGAAVHGGVGPGHAAHQREAPGSLCHDFCLAGGAGTLTRFLGEELATSPLHRAWAADH